MELRPYQLNVIHRTRESFSEGNNKPLVVLPCGAGKTVCFAYMARNHVLKNTNNVVWFMVHRRELIDQTLETFSRMNLDMTNIQVGMVQSYSKMKGKPSLIIFDEAHHATANTWKRIIEENKDVPLIGLTATPARMNGDPLGNIFDSLIIGPQPEELIEQGYLSKFDYYAPKLNINESAFVIKGGDYDQESVTEEFEKAKIYGDIAKYIDMNRKTIIYSPSI
jgi:superfamily II DNA or RNA helicase